MSHVLNTSEVWRGLTHTNKCNGFPHAVEDGRVEVEPLSGFEVHRGHQPAVGPVEPQEHLGGQLLKEQPAMVNHGEQPGTTDGKRVCTLEYHKKTFFWTCKLASKYTVTCHPRNTLTENGGSISRF